jgi:translation elongation factor EF-Ts
MSSYDVVSTIHQSLSIGEGLEKKSNDFAAEVAAATGQPQ